MGPGCRCGHADDKYSLDCEEAEDAERLRADRHFPLNIQETGVNKEKEPEGQSPRSAELRITELQGERCGVGGGVERWMAAWRRLSGHFSPGSEVSIRRRTRRTGCVITQVGVGGGGGGEGRKRRGE